MQSNAISLTRGLLYHEVPHGTGTCEITDHNEGNHNKSNEDSCTSQYLQIIESANLEGRFQVSLGFFLILTFICVNIPLVLIAIQCEFMNTRFLCEKVGLFQEHSCMKDIFTFIFIGSMIGHFFFPIFCEYFGRKIIWQVILVISLLTSSILILAQNFYLFLFSALFYSSTFFFKILFETISNESFTENFSMKIECKNSFIVTLMAISCLFIIYKFNNWKLVLIIYIVMLLLIFYFGWAYILDPPYYLLRKKDYKTLKKKLILISKHNFTFDFNVRVMFTKLEHQKKFSNHLLKIDFMDECKNLYIANFQSFLQLKRKILYDFLEVLRRKFWRNLMHFSSLLFYYLLPLIFAKSSIEISYYTQLFFLKNIAIELNVSCYCIALLLFLAEFISYLLVKRLQLRFKKFFKFWLFILFLLSSIFSVLVAIFKDSVLFFIFNMLIFATSRVLNEYLSIGLQSKGLQMRSFLNGTSTGIFLIILHYFINSYTQPYGIFCIALGTSAILSCIFIKFN